MMRVVIVGRLILIILLGSNAIACAQDQQNPQVGRFPHIEVDAENKRIRVECQALNVEMPLEFFCVLVGTSEHESVLRTPARPSDLHTALLMLGLQPGSPVRYSPATEKWLAPHGPPLQIFCEFEKDGKKVVTPAYRWMRSVQTKQPMPPLTWVFAGSRVMPDGVYAADATGYVVSIVNFDLTLIDIPKLASNANETLEWEYNPDAVPRTGTTVWMIIEPAGDAIAPAEIASTQPAVPPADPKDNLRIETLREKWRLAVIPHDVALRGAAQAHYDVINELRSQQQKLIDQADQIQRLIDELEAEYQDMTTPRPQPAEPKKE